MILSLEHFLIKKLNFFLFFSLNFIVDYKTE
jgi:hypothetical protein